ncbi:not available [Bacillus cereus]|nr:not available [Bacillus cereus]
MFKVIYFYVDKKYKLSYAKLAFILFFI